MSIDEMAMDFVPDNESFIQDEEPIECPECEQSYYEEDWEDTCPLDDDHHICPNCGYCLEHGLNKDDIYEEEF